MKNETKTKNLIYVFVLLAYSALTLTGVLNHEIWHDEAQAWCVVRDNDIPGIINHLKFEGHPILWYLILYPLPRLGLSCISIGFISWAFSTITVGLLLFKLRLPTSVKLITMCSCGFLFYNSVTSRPYCLIALLLVLLSLTYSKRKEHPILFGTLVALLANTHICMSGLVGILGIQMIYELFKHRKESRLKLSILRIIGLVIAGAGVITLILPLLMSLVNNHAVVDSPVTVNNILSRITGSFQNISLQLIPDIAGIKNAGGAVISIMIILVLILLRHYPKGLIASISFIVFYVLSTQIIYTVVQPTRSITFFYTLMIIYYTVKENEKSRERTKSINLKTDTKLIKKLLDFLSFADTNHTKSIAVLFCAIMCLSIPRGVYWYVTDITGQYSLSCKTAEFIKEELQEDAVFIVDGDYFVSLSAYLPEAKFYYPELNRFVTYLPNISIKDKECDKKKMLSDLKNFDNIYLLSFSDVTDDEKAILYSDSIEPDLIFINRYIKISNFEIEKFLSE